MLADDAFRITGLERGLAHRTVFGDVHGDERVPQDVVGEVEVLEDFAAGVFGVFGDEEEAGERVGLQPVGEIGLNGDVALHSHLGYLGLDMNHPGGEVDALGLELGNLAVVHAGANTRKETKGEIGHERPAFDPFDVTHERRRLLRRDRDG